MEIRRDIYLNKLISKKHNGLIKVITGMRRCGKSYLLFNLFRDHLAKLNVPDDHIIEMAFDAYENKRFRDPEVFFPYLMQILLQAGQMTCFILSSSDFKIFKKIKRPSDQ